MKVFCLIVLSIACAGLLIIGSAWCDSSYNSDVYFLQQSDLVIKGVVQEIEVEALHIPDHVLAGPRINARPGQGPGMKYDIYHIQIERVLKGFYPLDTILVIAVSNVPSDPACSPRRTQVVSGMKSHACSEKYRRVIACVNAKPYLRAETGEFFFKNRTTAWPLILENNNHFSFKGDPSSAVALEDLRHIPISQAPWKPVPSTSRMSLVYAATADAGWFYMKDGQWVSLETGIGYEQSRIVAIIESTKLSEIRKRADMFVDGAVISKPERIVERYEGNEVAIVYEFRMKVDESVALKQAVVPKRGDEITVRTKEAGTYVPDWAAEYQYLMIVPQKGERWLAFLKLHADGFYYPFAGANGLFKIYHDASGEERVIYYGRVGLGYTRTDLVESVKNGIPIKE